LESRIWGKVYRKAIAYFGEGGVSLREELIVHLVVRVDNPILAVQAEELAACFRRMEPDIGRHCWR
jgi:hypothetical protein